MSLATYASATKNYISSEYKWHGAMLRCFLNGLCQLESMNAESKLLSTVKILLILRVTFSVKNLRVLAPNVETFYKRIGFG